VSVTLHEGDCLAVMPALGAEGVRFDAVITDPPYHLKSIVERFGKPGSAPAKGIQGYINHSKDFMGRIWDGGEVAFEASTWRQVARLMKPGAWLVAFSHPRYYHRMASAIEAAGFDIRDLIGWLYSTALPKSRNLEKDLKRLGLVELAEAYSGHGSALKPAIEPICLARKPFGGSLAANIRAHGTGALAIADCSVRVAGEADRWPANVIHDGLAEVVEAFGVIEGASAARFFYSAKADGDDRFGSRHPTVKPIDLMAYLVRLVCPTGGTVLDPFAGSGTTGVAALREGRSAVLIEREPDYAADIRARLAYYQGEGRHKLAELQRNAGAGELPELPLFAEGGGGAGR
jgi:site-specific DNA-methyltransferase (adenine-specific)